MLVLLWSVRQGQLQQRETVRRPLGAPPIAVTSVHCRGSSAGSYALRCSCCSARGVLVGQNALLAIHTWRAIHTLTSCNSCTRRSLLPQSACISSSS